MTKKSVEEKVEKILKELEKAGKKGLSFPQLKRITGIKDYPEVLERVVLSGKADWQAHWKLHLKSKA